MKRIHFNAKLVVAIATLALVSRGPRVLSGPIL